MLTTAVAYAVAGRLSCLPGTGQLLAC